MCIRDSSRGGRNSWCSGEMLRYHEELRLRRQLTGLQLTLDVYKRQADNSVKVINTTLKEQKGLTATGKVYNLDGKEMGRYSPVSYTHLDVYKRQLPNRATGNT